MFEQHTHTYFEYDFGIVCNIYDKKVNKTVYELNCNQINNWINDCGKLRLS